MVVEFLAAALARCGSTASWLNHRLFAQMDGPVPGPVELDPVTRGRLLLALLAIALLGVGLIVMVNLGGRMARRRLRLPPIAHRPTPVPPKRWSRPGMLTKDNAADPEDD